MNRVTVNHGILQTALTNKTLGLELAYREPATEWDGDVTFAYVFSHSCRSNSEEFSAILSAI